MSFSVKFYSIVFSILVIIQAIECEKANFPVLPFNSDRLSQRLTQSQTLSKPQVSDRILSQTIAPQEQRIDVSSLPTLLQSTDDDYDEETLDSNSAHSEVPVKSDQNNVQILSKSKIDNVLPSTVSPELSITITMEPKKESSISLLSEEEHKPSVSDAAMAKSSINQKLQEKAETRTLTDLSAKNSESLSVDSSVSKDHLNAGAIESIAVTTLNPVLDSDHKVIHHDHEEGEDDHHDHDSLIKTPIGGKTELLSTGDSKSSSSLEKKKQEIELHETMKDLADSKSLLASQSSKTDALTEPHEELTPTERLKPVVKTQPEELLPSKIESDAPKITQVEATAKLNEPVKTTEAHESDLLNGQTTAIGGKQTTADSAKHSDALLTAESGLHSTDPHSIDTEHEEHDSVHTDQTVGSAVKPSLTQIKASDPLLAENKLGDTKATEEEAKLVKQNKVESLPVKSEDDHATLLPADSTKTISETLLPEKKKEESVGHIDQPLDSKTTLVSESKPKDLLLAKEESSDILPAETKAVTEVAIDGSGGVVVKKPLSSDSHEDESLVKEHSKHSEDFDITDDMPISDTLAEKKESEALVPAVTVASADHPDHIAKSDSITTVQTKSEPKQSVVPEQEIITVSPVHEVSPDLGVSHVSEPAIGTPSKTIENKVTPSEVTLDSSEHSSLPIVSPEVPKSVDTTHTVDHKPSVDSTGVVLTKDETIKPSIASEVTSHEANEAIPLVSTSSPKIALESSGVSGVFTAAPILLDNKDSLDHLSDIKDPIAPIKDDSSTLAKTIETNKAIEDKVMDHGHHDDDGDSAMACGPHKAEIVDENSGDPIMKKISSLVDEFPEDQGFKEAFLEFIETSKVLFKKYIKNGIKDIDDDDNDDDDDDTHPVAAVIISDTGNKTDVEHQMKDAIKKIKEDLDSVQSKQIISNGDKPDVIVIDDESKIDSKTGLKKQILMDNESDVGDHLAKIQDHLDTADTTSRVVSDPRIKPIRVPQKITQTPPWPLKTSSVYSTPNRLIYSGSMPMAYKVNKYPSLPSYPPMASISPTSFKAPSSWTQVLVPQRRYPSAYSVSSVPQWPQMESFQMSNNLLANHNPRPIISRVHYRVPAQVYGPQIQSHTNPLLVSNRWPSMTPTISSFNPFVSQISRNPITGSSLYASTASGSPFSSFPSYSSGGFPSRRQQSIYNPNLRSNGRLIMEQLLRSNALGSQSSVVPNRNSVRNLSQKQKPYAKGIPKAVVNKGLKQNSMATNSQGFSPSGTSAF